MIAKTALILLVGVAAYAAGNPAAGVEWRWTPRHATVTTNIKALPFEKLIDTYVPIVRVPGLKTVPGCGPTRADERIVGGSEATPHSFPWMVALFIDDIYFCGGSIISDRWIVSAGHCLHNARRAEVVAGAHNIRINEPSQVTLISTELYVHENYNAFTIKNDISLIHLPTPLTFNDNIAPVCLPAYSAVPLHEGEWVTPSGWGRYSDNIQGISSVLREVTVPTITNTQCSLYYGSSVYDGVVCIDTTGGHGVCNGDSGGPLNYVVGSTTYTRGITSYGSTAGCEAGYPDAFSRIHYFLDWIELKTGIAIDN